jgi:hypothetical protein
MGKFEWDWFIGWTCATTIVLGLVTAIYFGVKDTSAKYYASMDKCTAAGGSFIPMARGDASCLMGMKQ